VRAVRLGGRLTGISALPLLGVWQPPDARLHVVVPRNAARLRDPDHRFDRLLDRPDVHVHWQEPERVKERLLRFEPVAEPLTALLHAIECCADELAVAVLDSALQTLLITPADRERIRAELPRHRRALIDLLDGRAESGGESVVRYRLRLAGYRVEVQVRIQGVGRVDLLVEGRLVLEIDGRQFHDGAGAFAEDRRRDLALSAQHLGHLRLTYRQIFDDWPACLAGIAAALD
jgi:very-short-patch-repair endonuclease